MIWDEIVELCPGERSIPYRKGLVRPHWPGLGGPHLLGREEEGLGGEPFVGRKVWGLVLRLFF